MKTLVTGATGFVGREVVKELHAGGHVIRLLVRNPRAAAAQALAASADAEVCAGDILDAASLARAMDGTEAVIHLVGIISEAPPREYEVVHTQGTKNVLAAAQAAGATRFAHMSALGVRPGAVARYHRSKWEAEEAVRSSGLDWTIFRPSIIYGPDDQFVNLFARLARWSPFIPVMGSGLGKLQPVPVELIAAAFVRCLTEPRAIGQTFDLCGPEPMTFVEVLASILKAQRTPHLRAHLPMAMARGLAWALEQTFPRFLGRPPPLNRDQLIMLQEDNVGNPEPADALFGLTPPPFREGIARYLTPRR